MVVASLKETATSDKGIYQSRSVQKALRILRAFSMERPTQSLAEIARRAGVNPSTAYRLLSTLETEGFVERTNGSAAYTLSMRMFELGSIVLHGMDINVAGIPVLARLATETGDTTYLTVLYDDAILCVARIEGAQHVRSQFLEVGRRLPLHAGAASKVFLAHLLPDRARELLEKDPLIPFTENTVTDPEDLLVGLAQIRANGYAMSVEEITPGITAIAAPILDASAEVAAALTLSGASAHFESACLLSMIEKTRNAAYEVSVRLGYVPRFNG
jgi:IclR family transcriptional regulator, KDG regulon repressor